MTKHLRIHYLLRLSFFWLLYFGLFRILFIIWHHHKLRDGINMEVMQSLVAGYRLDFSSISYLILVPLILWSMQQFFRHRFVHKANQIFNVLLIIIVTILSIANIIMYGEWGTILNYRAFTYIIYPKEVLAFTTLTHVLLAIVVIGSLSFLGIFLYRRIVINFSYEFENIWKRVFLMAIFPLVIFIGLRGGIQQIPINESSACYSAYQINNHIATNNLWYLGHSFLDAKSDRNIYAFMEHAEAEKVRARLFESVADSTEIVLKVQKPNVVFIVLESWTADVIKALGGEQRVSPYFDEMTKQGLLFTQAYSSGTRTDQGLVSVFSGFPAQPNNSIITIPSKAEKLKSICHNFIDAGYTPSFYYGGEIGFANMKTYLVASGFNKIVDKNNFAKEQLNSKWGAHDEFVFERQLADLKAMPQPFFSALLTLSTHEPFEVPRLSEFQGSNEEDKFRNAAYYTDQCLKEYFDSARQEPWYKNTLFVLVADHGHHLPQNNDMDHPKAKRITMMLYGEALADKWRGKTFDRITGQNDIPAIVIGQLGLKGAADFPWSKNVFNKEVEEFAYYANENVLGWIVPGQKIMYTYASRRTSEADSKEIDETQVMNAKAYLQTLYQEFLDY